MDIQLIFVGYPQKIDLKYVKKGNEGIRGFCIHIRGFCTYIFFPTHFYWTYLSSYATGSYQNKTSDLGFGLHVQPQNYWRPTCSLPFQSFQKSFF